MLLEPEDLQNNHNNKTEKFLMLSTQRRVLWYLKQAVIAISVGNFSSEKKYKYFATRVRASKNLRAITKS